MGTPGSRACLFLFVLSFLMVQTSHPLEGGAGFACLLQPACLGNMGAPSAAVRRAPAAFRADSLALRIPLLLLLLLGCHRSKRNSPQPSRLRRLSLPGDTPRYLPSTLSPTGGGCSPGLRPRPMKTVQPSRGGGPARRRVSTPGCPGVRMAGSSEAPSLGSRACAPGDFCACSCLISAHM